MKHRYAIVLARNAQEAHTYAKRAGLARFTYRVPANPGSLRGLQSADVHILPGFHGRRDRHALLAELRYGRDIVKMDVEMPEPLEAPPVDQGDGMGEQLTIEDALAATPPVEEKPQWQKDLDAVLEPEGWEPPETLDAGQVLALAAAPEERGSDVLSRVDQMRALAEEATETEETDGVTTGTSEPGEDAASPTPRRRRKRCPECSELVFDLESHTASKHAPVAPVAEEPAAPVVEGNWF